MPFDGLRRRSPNPDYLSSSSGSHHSPTSPDAPSLYSVASSSRVPEDLRWTQLKPASRRPHTQDRPSIKLIGRVEHLQHRLTPTGIPFRSKSDDGGHNMTAGFLIPPATVLQRSESTPDPRSYPSPSRRVFVHSNPPVETDETVTRRSIWDKPMPTLPLRIEKRSAGQEDLGEATSLRPTRSLASSVFSFKNPFRRKGSLVPFPLDGDEGASVVHGEDSCAKSIRAPSMRSKWSSRSALDAQPLLSQSVPRAHLDQGIHKTTASTCSPPTGQGLVEKEMKAPGVLASRGGILLNGARFPELGVAPEGGWTVFKWILLGSVTTVFCYGLGGMIWALLILSSVHPFGGVIMVSDPDVVIFLTLASSLCLISSLVGLSGVILNSRPILAFYNLLLWPTFLSITFIGYTSYRRGSLQLDRKLNQAWSQWLGPDGKLVIQNSLHCCGYYTPYHGATYSKKCYPRTQLPGCKLAWTAFEQDSLNAFSDAAFSTVPFHILNIIIALLCSNHVTSTFGCGIVPPTYVPRPGHEASTTTAPHAGEGSLDLARSVLDLPRYTEPLTRPPSYVGALTA